METQWNTIILRNCLIFLCGLSVMTADTAWNKQFGNEYMEGIRLSNFGYSGNRHRNFGGREQQSRTIIAMFPKGDLCNEYSSECQLQEQDPSFNANIRIGRARNTFHRSKFVERQLRPVFIVEDRPSYQYSYSPPVKTSRLDAIDVMEHLLVKGLEYGGWKNPAAKKKKYTLGKGQRPYVWNESEDEEDFESEFDGEAEPFDMYRPTGNIYHAGNKYYSGSHDHINLLKKYGVTKYKHAKYHLKPLVTFESPDDYDDLWDREYDRSLRFIPIFQRGY